MPDSSAYQTQDATALALVTRALGNVVQANETVRDNHSYQKIHRIDNLNDDESFKSLEKRAVFRSVRKGGKMTEELVSIEPRGAKPAANLVDLRRFLNGFLNRQNFRYTGETRTIGGLACIGVAFEPKVPQPDNEDNIDHIISRARGTIWVAQPANLVCEINGGLARTIDYFLFGMDKFNFRVEFQDWNGMNLVSRMRVTTKYSYLAFVRRHQTHTFEYAYFH